MRCYTPLVSIQTPSCYHRVAYNTEMKVCDLCMQAYTSTKTRTLSSKLEVWCFIQLNYGGMLPNRVAGRNIMEV